jgi:hypothetical protein
MKVEFAPTFQEQVGASTLEAFENKYLGVKGTRKRYLNDRMMVKDSIKDAFMSFLLFPLRFLPYGHVAESFWYALARESSLYGVMDAMSFAYLDDAYVVGIRPALAGERHKWHRGRFADNQYGPYIENWSYKPPYWLITRIVWPHFKEIYTLYTENK